MCKRIQQVQQVTYFTICYSKLLTHRNVYGGEVGRDIYIYSNESFFFFFHCFCVIEIIRLGKKCIQCIPHFARSNRSDVYPHENQRYNNLMNYTSIDSHYNLHSLRSNSQFSSYETIIFSILHRRRRRLARTTKLDPSEIKINQFQSARRGRIVRYLLRFRREQQRSSVTPSRCPFIQAS